MLLAMILLIVIGIVILILFTLCRVATLSDMYMEALQDPEYLVDEEEEDVGAD
ncbi:MAG: hypothetical protein LIP11_16015 [Clostridiales bacterium]|nr:hypothetical protein [Clostridiales bacterium]